MRAPSASLVVDATILIAAVRGRSSGAIRVAQGAAMLLTTDRVVHEARRRIELGLRRTDLLDVLNGLLDQITVVPVAVLEPRLAESETVLRQAVAGGNGSTRDAHVLALARDVDADVWTTDHDFAGTGVATWSTPNLIRGFANAGAEFP